MRVSIIVMFASMALRLVSSETAECSTLSSTQEEGDELSMLQRKKIHGKHSFTESDAIVNARSGSLELGHVLAGLAIDPAQSSETQQLFQSFRICGQCSSFRRFGEPHDGGYLMCMDGLKEHQLKAAYSFGVEHHDQWSEDVVKEFGVTVNQFDCTVDSSSCKGCKFFKKCIVSQDGMHPGPRGKENDWNMAQALEQTSQANASDGSLLLKMDIEGSEWPVYATEQAETLKKFGQIIVEFHWIQKADKHAEYLKAVQHILAAGFKVVHLHGNNYAGMYTVNTKTIPDVLEVTFAHSAARPDGCSSDQDMQQLDAANNPSSPELPLAKLSD